MRGIKRSSIHKPRWTIVIVLGSCLALSVAGLLMTALVQGSPSRNIDSSLYVDEDIEEGTEKAEESDYSGESNEGAEICTGFTCQFRSICGKAPLNRLKGSSSVPPKTRPQMEPFVVNGQAQVYGEWPSYVRLIIPYNLRMNQERTTFTCGGVLVSDRHVLTGAHCLFHPESRAPIDAKEIWVVLGDHSTMKRDKYERGIPVESSCVSSKFSFEETDQATYLIYDHAVLTLKNPIKFNDYYQPACLPYEPLEASEKLHCYLIGQGAVGFGSRNNTMPAKTVTKVPMRHASCAALGFYEDESRACMTSKSASGSGGSCLGDSGAPILCLDPQNQRWTVIGTVSYGPINCRMYDDRDDLITVTARTTSLLSSLKAECSI